ncbi:hypothetical protein [Caldithrix abyssi]
MTNKSDSLFYLRQESLKVETLIILSGAVQKSWPGRIVINPQQGSEKANLHCV